jgi:hypothetical protein
MSTLASQQTALRRAIIAPEPADGPEEAAIDGLLRPRDDGAPLLRIYQNAYSGRLADALRDNYGVLPLVMGDEAFDELAAAYIAEHPSQYPSIRWFGDRMASFMDARGDLVPHPAFADLARMEWTLRLAFDAADAEVLQPQALASLPADQWPSLVFSFLPSVHLLPLSWNVEPAWRAFKAYDPEGDAAEPELPEPQQVAHQLLVWRRGLETHWRAIDGLAADLLLRARAGDSFATLCELAAEEMGVDQAAASVVANLQQWLTDGLLGGFSADSQTRPA